MYAPTSLTLLEAHYSITLLNRLQTLMIKDELNHVNPYQIIPNHQLLIELVLFACISVNNSVILSKISMTSSLSAID